MSDSQRLEHLERDVAQIKATQAAHGEMLVAHGETLVDLKGKLAAQGETLTDIKSTLGQLMTLLVRMGTDIGELRGKASDAPTARDFGRLEGRVDAIEARQPVTLAYQPPQPPRQG